MARPKGSLNKRTVNVEQIAERFKLDPFEVLMMVACGDWEGLGLSGKTKTSYTNAGIEFEEDTIPIKERVNAAKEACRYLHSAKASVEVSTGNTGFKVIVEDYMAKKDKT